MWSSQSPTTAVTAFLTWKKREQDIESITQEVVLLSPKAKRFGFEDKRRPWDNLISSTCNDTKGRSNSALNGTCGESSNSLCARWETTSSTFFPVPCWMTAPVASMTDTRTRECWWEIVCMRGLTRPSACMWKCSEEKQVKCTSVTVALGDYTDTISVLIYETGYILGYCCFCGFNGWISPALRLCPLTLSEWNKQLIYSETCL